MSKTNELLLETTIQIFRVVETIETKANLNRELHGKQVFTSSFVYREFLRTIITDVIYVWNAVKETTPDTDGQVGLGVISRFLAQGKGNFSARSAKRMHYVMAAVQESFKQTQIPQQRLIRRLERIGQQWERDFFEALSPIDGQAIPIHCLCNLDDPSEIERLRQGRPFPEMPLFPTGAATFLEKHKELVQKAEEAMHVAGARHKDSSLLDVLKRLKKTDGEYDFLQRLKINTRGNWCLGDLLISLETPPPPTGAVYTIDRHYEILCPAIGKLRYQGFMPQRGNSSFP